MAGSAFDIEQARLAASRRLPVNCHDDFLRLSRTLVHGPAFQWLLVDAPDELLRRQVMQELQTVLHVAGLRSNQLPLSGHIADVAALEARLVKNAQSADVIHVVGRPGWFDVGRWDAFNARRERLSAEVKARLVFWLDEDAIALASGSAPDLWAWRGGVYAFLPDVSKSLQSGGSTPAHKSSSAPDALPSGPDGEDRRTMAERSRRVAEIRTWLRDHPHAPDELLTAPLNELGRLLHELGDHDEALHHWRSVELPFHQRTGNASAEAITRGKIAGVLQARGQLDEALRIRREEVLPVFERLGDLRSKAITLGQIGDILQARGQLDEALRIRQEEELPVYERLGDQREKAITMGQIADILQARGQLDEALRIREEEQLPVYERLGEVRSKAVTLGKIADILQARGRLDQALRIRQEEELPVYERLGDIRSKAVTMGKIADILQARGQFDEALRIRQVEQLPIYLRLGERQGEAITTWKIGMQQLTRGKGWTERATPLLVSAWKAATEMQLPEAAQMGAFLRGKGILPEDKPG